MAENGRVPIKTGVEAGVEQRHERGDIREHVNVFVGNTEARSTGGLATPLANGMEISILPVISGGRVSK